MILINILMRFIWSIWSIYIINQSYSSFTDFLPTFTIGNVYLHFFKLITNFYNCLNVKIVICKVFGNDILLIKDADKITQKMLKLTNLHQISLNLQSKLEFIKYYKQQEEFIIQANKKSV